MLEFESLFAREKEPFFLMNADFCFLVLDFLTLDILLVVSEAESRSLMTVTGQELVEIDVMMEASMSLPSLAFFI